MIRVAALTSGRNLPSARFRIRQHINSLQKEGIIVNEFFPRIDKASPVPFWPQNISPKYILPLYAFWQGVKLSTRMRGLIGSWAADVTWLGRELLPGYLTFEPLLKKPLIFDVDDAIWLAHPFGEKAIGNIARRAELIFAGNDYLAEWLSEFSCNIRILPTAVDTQYFSPNSNSYDEHDNFVIGWIGTSGNLQYLEALESPLRSFLSENSRSQLLIVSDSRPNFKTLSKERVRFCFWEEAIEVNAIRSMSVGLMPLPNTEWARGKCSYKMLQYMSCGVPVIVSPVGMNATILSMDNVGFSAERAAEWYGALTELYKNRKKRKVLGKNGRKVVEENFSAHIISKRISKEIFRLRNE